MRCHWLAGGLVGWALAACSTPGAFVCEQDSQCSSAGMAGVCQLDQGYCSFPDTACPSGQRFGEHSGDGLAGECVGAELGSTSTTGPTPETSTTAASTSLTTSALTTAPDDDTSSTGHELDESTTSAPPSCPADWWDCAWAWRLPLTVAWDGAPLAGFPLRVSLTPARLDLADASSDGADLRVVSNDGEPLVHELEWLSPEEGRAELWVRMPELAADAKLWLYWGNPGAADEQDSSSVWADGHTAVWHMTPALDDATGQYPLVDLGTMHADGRIGPARAFDGVTTLLRPADDATFLDLFASGGTVSAWIRPSGWGQGGFGRIIDNATTNTSVQGWNVAVAGTGELRPASLRFAIDYDVQRGTWESSANALALGEWRHVAVTYDASDPTSGVALYVDGVPVVANELSTPMGQPNLVSPNPATIGAMGTGAARFFDGTIDELRLSATRRSPEWIAAEARSGADLLLEYGPAQMQP